MTQVACVTRTPDQILSYLGFGFYVAAEGEGHVSSGPVKAYLLEGPERHAEWQVGMLRSGLHTAQVVDGKELEEWVRKFSIVWE